LQGLKFGLDNARKDVRYYTHLAESNNVPSVVGEAVHQTLCLASALGYGAEFVPSLVRAQEKVTGVKLVP
jgi:3-hydroxyisobutyrate dehydrogenase-like beta-hydroxyacid dehydrogenase